MIFHFSFPFTVAEAEAAGAAVVGAEELAERILGGEIPFDRCIATPDMMPVVAKVARVSSASCLAPTLVL